MLYDEAIKMATEKEDAPLLFKLGQQADQENRDELIQKQILATQKAKERIAQEKAKKIAFDNHVKAGMYLAKDDVKTVFAHFYAAHATMLGTLGMKLAETIAGICGVNDRAIIDSVRQKIDEEVYQTLGEIQKDIKEYIGS
jgi:hypothetical protein